MWVDLEPGTSAMSAEQLERTWDPATKAVLIVHAHGYPTDVGGIVPIAHQRGAAVIEDITHAPGAWSGGHRVGSIGDVMVMSCSPTKPLGAIGNAGLAATDSSDIAGSMREYLSYGFENESLKAVHAGVLGAEFDYATVGINGMPDEIQAAVLRRKLTRLDEWADLRRKQLSVYERSLRNVPGVRMVQGQGQQRPAPRHLIANAGANRDAILGLLRDRGVGATAGYYPGLHSQDVYADLARAPLPAARDFEQSIVALPIGPEFTSGEIEASAEALCRVVATL
jgi:dTDP-4-amino-4,6-dideoxygalactose transaminase